MQYKRYVQAKTFKEITITFKLWFIKTHMCIQDVRLGTIYTILHHFMITNGQTFKNDVNKL